ncbi:hypothetical protein ACR6C2_18280 [Streptomyces sp. INA 01156]
MNFALFRSWTHQSMTGGTARRPPCRWVSSSSAAPFGRLRLLPLFGEGAGREARVPPTPRPPLWRVALGVPPTMPRPAVPEPAVAPGLPGPDITAPARPGCCGKPLTAPSWGNGRPPTTPRFELPGRWPGTWLCCPIARPTGLVGPVVGPTGPRGAAAPSHPRPHRAGWPPWACPRG